ncbi:MAG: sulfotransferase family 2 domain-containing protein [Verrucomicrobiota bacterium]
MIISHKYKFIFIRTLKTASTSIENQLYDFLDKGDICSGLVEGNLVEGLPAKPPLNSHGYFNPFCDSSDKLSILENLSLALTNFSRSRRKLKFHRPHMEAWMIKNRLTPEIWNSYFKFCFERNPFDKTVSRYFQKIKEGEKFTFKEYVNAERLPVNYPIYTDRYDPDKIIVDYVGHFENLNAELGFIAEKTGLPFEGKIQYNLKSNFRPPKLDYREIVDPESRQIIERVFERELRFHNYSF